MECEAAAAAAAERLNSAAKYFADDSDWEDNERIVDGDDGVVLTPRRRLGTYGE